MLFLYNENFLFLVLKPRNQKDLFLQNYFNAYQNILQII